MTATLALGPLMFPADLLVLIGSAALGLLAARLLSRDAWRAIEGSLWALLGTVLLVSRLAYVWTHRDAYLPHPWHILDIRDGGWMAPAGIAAALAGTMWLAWRRRRHATALLAACVVACLAWLVGLRLATGPLPPAPDWRALPLQTLAQTPVSLADFAGKPLVVNLWASWCPPCRREMPAFAQAQAAYPGIHFVFLNQGESAETIRAFLQRESLALRNVWRDPAGAVATAAGTRGLPTTLFIDADGTLVDVRMGELSHATLAQRLRALSPAPP